MARALRKVAIIAAVVALAASVVGGPAALTVAAVANPVASIPPGNVRLLPPRHGPDEDWRT